MLITLNGGNKVMNYSMKEKQALIKKIIDNDFETNSDLSIMYLLIDNQTIELSDFELEEIMGYIGCSVKQRVKIAKGKNAEEFYNETGFYKGYRLFDLEKHPEFKEGEFIEDTNKHGLYFTINRNELFRFVMSSHKEDFGVHIAEISLKHNDQFVTNAAIAKGYDSKGTYRSHCFYIEKTYSINDYQIILELFDIAPDEFKLLIYDDSERSLYSGSVKYYSDKGCDQTVAALKDIHNSYKI